MLTSPEGKAEGNLSIGFQVPQTAKMKDCLRNGIGVSAAPTILL
jgi:hypothetical protein